MSPTHFVASVTLALGCTGCLGTRTEQIVVRRPPSLLEGPRRDRPPTVEELDQEAIDARRAAEVPTDVVARTTHFARTEAVVRATLDTIAPDPWEAEEADRVRYLRRRWSDVTRPWQPGAEGEGADAGEADAE